MQRINDVSILLIGVESLDDPAPQPDTGILFRWNSGYADRNNLTAQLSVGVMAARGFVKPTATDRYRHFAPSFGDTLRMQAAVSCTYSNADKA